MTPMAMDALIAAAIDRRLRGFMAVLLAMFDRA